MKSKMNGHLGLSILLLFLFCMPQRYFGQHDDRIIVIVGDGMRGPGLGGYASLEGEPLCWMANEGNETVSFIDRLEVRYSELEGESFDVLEIQYTIKDKSGNFVEITSPEGTSNPFVLSYDISSDNEGQEPPPFTVTELWNGDIFETDIFYSTELPEDFPIEDELDFRVKVRVKEDGSAWELVHIIEFTSNICAHSEGSFRKASIPSDAMGLHVSPNPFDSQLQLKWEKEAPLISEISILDAQGRTVLQESWTPVQGNSLNLDTEKLAKGMYVLQIKSGKQTVNHKIIKAN